MDGKDSRRTIVLLLLYRYCVFIICACLDGEGRSSGLVRGREKKKLIIIQKDTFAPIVPQKTYTRDLLGSVYSDIVYTTRQCIKKKCMVSPPCVLCGVCQRVFDDKLVARRP